MKPVISFLLLLLTLQVTGQPLTVIHDLLSGKKFQPFKNFVDSAPKSNVKFKWLALRDVVANYQEGIVEIEEFTAANDGTGRNRIINYRIDLLATDQEIFYYNYIKTIYKAAGDDQWERSDSTIAGYKNEQLYQSFRRSFRQTYNSPLRSGELFQTSIIYGVTCGFGGAEPEQMQMVKRFLENDHMDSIGSWLRSPNAEKQLYAIHGYRILSKAGYTLSAEEKYLIQKVKQKKGKANTCDGCLFARQSIREAVTEIETFPTRYVYTLNKKSEHKQEPLQMSISFILAAVILFIAHRKNKLPDLK